MRLSTPTAPFPGIGATLSERKNFESFIQPFFILLAVPLALIGVFVAFPMSYGAYAMIPIPYSLALQCIIGPCLPPLSADISVSPPSFNFDPLAVGLSYLLHPGVHGSR